MKFAKNIINDKMMKLMLCWKYLELWWIDHFSTLKHFTTAIMVSPARVKSSEWIYSRITLQPKVLIFIGAYFSVDLHWYSDEFADLLWNSCDSSLCLVLFQHLVIEKNHQFPQITSQELFYSYEYFGWKADRLVS